MENNSTIKHIDPPIIKIFDSGIAGPRVVVIGGMHGDEPSAVRFLKNVLNGEEMLNIRRGSVTVVIANPTAHKLGVRGVNINLNSILTTADIEVGPQPEFKSANILIDILSKSDACIDLHEHKDIDFGSLAFTPFSSVPKASLLGPNLVVYGMEILEPGASDSFMAEIGKLGICFELGYHKNDNTAAARRVVDQFLTITNISDADIPLNQLPRIAKARNLLIRKGKKFHFAQHVKSGDILPLGIFAQDDDRELIAKEKNTGVLFPRPNNPIGTSVGILIDYSDKTYDFFKTR